ncbi:MAG TPA: hypothetical protein VFB31_19460 [Pseudolabrys sp.]|nr:hypothetical protein [Pseudolabrys sp.]
MHKLLVAAAAAVLLSVTAAFADPVGKYDVEGTNPGGGGRYSGTVSVERTGDTYKVVWVVGGTRYIGTGIGDKDFLAVSYRSGNETGLALYASSKDGWKGIWTYANGTKIGTERWTEQ